jgi:transposase
MTLPEKELACQLAECQEALARSRRENELLRQKLDLLIRRVFGASSERLDRAQLELLLKQPESLTDPEPVGPSTFKVTSRNSRKERTPRLPENLPVVEEVIDPEPVKSRPEQWRCIGQEVSEQLDFEPARFLRRRTIRRKYVHRVDADGVPIIAPLPERLLDRSLPAPGCWRIFWWANTATTCRCIGRNKFSGVGMQFICRVRRWRAGSGWPPIGSNPSTNTSAPGSWLVAMCRWMKRRSIIWSRATARLDKAISGRAAVLAATCFSVGKPAVLPRAWTTSFP